MNFNLKFTDECRNEIEQMGKNKILHEKTIDWINQANFNKYSYHFTSLGRPIIQYPQDMVAMQELIWEIKPDLIIETGIAHGGSLILNASMLALLDMCESIETGVMLDPNRSRRKVLGIDIDVRLHNREAIEAHPMSSRIQMIQGSSVASDIIQQVKDIAKNYTRVLVS